MEILKKKTLKKKSVHKLASVFSTSRAKVIISINHSKPVHTKKEEQEDRQTERERNTRSQGKKSPDNANSVMTTPNLI